MQTFLPYGRDFAANAACLDDRRLGKQRVETYQILRTLWGVSDGWKNHPAVRMWEGWEDVLVIYGLHVCHAWQLRGYKDTVADKITQAAGPYFDGKHRRFDVERDSVWLRRDANSWWYSTWQYQSYLPPWIDDPRLAASHQANLYRKYPEYYIGYFGQVEPMDYWWPRPEEYGMGDRLSFYNYDPNKILQRTR
jgi:hypothetical protein